MSTKDWKTAAVEYADISHDRRKKGCAWCPDGFAYTVPGVLIDSGTGGEGSVFVVHTDCVEPMRHRARLREVVASVEESMESFNDAQAELRKFFEENENGTPDSQLYYDRDDAGVTVADQVGELLELIKGAGGCLS